MQGGDIVVGVHGVGVLGGGGGERDADKLLGVSGRRVGEGLGSEGVVAGSCDGVEEDEVAGVVRRRRRRGVGGVVDVAGVHEDESLEAIGWLDFGITMIVRRHRFWVRV